MCKYCEQLRDNTGQSMQEPIVDGNILVQIVPCTPISRRNGIGAILDIYVHHGGAAYSNLATIAIQYCPMCGAKLK